MKPVVFTSALALGDASGLEVVESIGYEGRGSTLIAVQLRNLPGQVPWVLGQARLIGSGGTPVKVLSVQMKATELAPGEEGLVVVEVKAAPWTVGKPFSVELVGPSDHRHLSFQLVTKYLGGPIP